MVREHAWSERGVVSEGNRKNSGWRRNSGLLVQEAADGAVRQKYILGEKQSRPNKDLRIRK